MNICIIGSGYVGLVTGSCLADSGNNVICLDIDQSKIADLKEGKVGAKFSLNNSEFGPRALGNRSILASPFSTDAVHHINQKIKVRLDPRWVKKYQP